MSENGQRHDRSLKDPVRIVYHAENRTFARLFNERSLDEVKDVVRRKLGLEPGTHVLLKQMGPNALLDLEDDGDFQAFCILLRSSNSVDIQVSMGRSQEESGEKPSVVEPTVAALASHSRVATTTKVSTRTKKTPGSSTRKRKVSFDGTTLETSDESAAVTAAVEPIEEPPKKKRREGTVKSAPRRASVTSSRKREAATSAIMDIEASEQPAKKPRKGREKQSESIGTDGTDPHNYQLNNPVDEASLQTAAEDFEMLDMESSSKSEKETIGVCASMPQTSASIRVCSEVAAAILSGHLPKASETLPEPPAKRKYVRRTTTKSTTVSPANEMPTVPTECRLEAVARTSEPLRQIPELNDPSCPICLQVPFHIRYCCPTVQKGPDAIRGRLEELKKLNANDQQSLIKELEGLLRDSEATSKPAVSTDDVQSQEVSQLPDASVSRTPNIPSNSYLSEVTVESRHEGSSSEGSDDISEGEARHKGLPASRGQETPGEQSSLNDLEAVIRGPTSRRQSVLSILDRIVGDEDDKDSESEDDKAESEANLDEEIDQSMRRVSRYIMPSPDSDSEEESRSPSSSRSDEDLSKSLKSSVYDSNKAVTVSVEHEDGGAIGTSSHDPTVPGGKDGDSSEETHVGSEDRVVVDGLIGEKGAVATVEEQLSSPVPRAPILQSLDTPIKEPQASGEAVDGPTFDQGGNFETIEPDPIEPADEVGLPNVTRLSNTDPIEAPSEDVESFLAGVTQSTPVSGVARRLRTRHGQILDKETEQPVLLDQLPQEVPLSVKRKSRRKDTEMNSQEPVTTRKSPRLLGTSTPAAVSLLDHRAKAKAAKTPAKPSEERSDALQNGARDLWETLAEPSSSPSIQLDEPSTPFDELAPWSSQLSNRVLKPPNIKGKGSQPSQAESSRGKQRLFDLTPSQVPFPYSQHKNPISTVPLNEEEMEVSTDSEAEPKVIQKRPKLSAPYRTLSQLASQATLYSPSLPTPTSKNVTNGKARKRAAAEDSSSSSSSEEEANESTHIPRGRRAGTVLETKKRRSILSKI